MLNGQLAAGRAAACGSAAVELVGLQAAQIWRLGVGRTFQITATFASHHRARERAGRAARRTHAPLLGCWHAGAHAISRDAERAARAASAWTSRPSAPARARLRRPQARRTRAGARQRAAAAADGRADRRHGAARAHRADGADAPESRASAASACCSPSTTWTSCSPMPTASSCSTRGELIAGGTPAQVRADPRRAARSISAAALTLSRAQPHAHALHADAAPRDVQAERCTAGRRSCPTSRSTSARARCVALLGRNGAGKSTTMKAIMGLVRAAQRARSRSRAATSSGCEPLPDRRGWAWATCRKTGASSPSSRCARIWKSAASPRAPARRAGRPSSCSTLFPNLAGDARPAGRPHVRRRAADAHDRAHADGQPALRPARRAVGGTGAGDRRADGADDPRTEAARAVACCCRSRTCTSRASVADRAYIIEKGQIRFTGTYGRAAGRTTTCAQLPERMTLVTHAMMQHESQHEPHRRHRRRRHLHRPHPRRRRRPARCALAKVPTTVDNQAFGVLAALDAARRRPRDARRRSCTARPRPPTRCSNASIARRRPDHDARLSRRARTRPPHAAEALWPDRLVSAADRPRDCGSKSTSAWTPTAACCIAARRGGGRSGRATPARRRRRIAS